MATAERRPAAPRPVYLDLLPDPDAAAEYRLDPCTGSPARSSCCSASRSCSGASSGAWRRPTPTRPSAATLAHPLWKLVLLGLAWAFLHHLCAGIRHLFLDVHIGIELAPARRSSVIVFVVSLALTLIVGGEAMVMRRQTVGAHYGLTDWLAQRRDRDRHDALRAAALGGGAVEWRPRLRALARALRQRRLQGGDVPVHGGAALPRVARRARDLHGLREAGRAPAYAAGGDDRAAHRVSRLDDPDPVGAYGGRG